jgi:hypothetical protein
MSASHDFTANTLKRQLIKAEIAGCKYVEKRKTDESSFNATYISECSQ